MAPEKTVKCMHYYAVLPMQLHLIDCGKLPQTAAELPPLYQSGSTKHCRACTGNSEALQCLLSCQMCILRADGVICSAIVHAEKRIAALQNELLTR